MTAVFERGLEQIAAQRQDRETSKRLEHVARGPCGGWHWINGRKNYCRACIALGSPSHSVRTSEES